MADAYVALLEDAEEQLGMGKEAGQNLRKLGDAIRNRLHTIAAAVETLEKKGWHWTTGAKDVYLHCDGKTPAQAKKEFADAGIPEDWYHFVD